MRFSIRRATDVAAGAVAILAMVAAGLAVVALHQPTSTPNALASNFGLQVVWSDSLECDGAPALGCYRETTPTVVYAIRGLDSEKERYVILHEIGHAMHDRAGVETSECLADKFAVSMGAVSDRDYC
jgi:Zn-dependent peptidase ImmA (M78 family)